MVDTVATVALLVLCWVRQSDTRIDRLRQAAVGIFGHGFGHLGLFMQWFGTGRGPRELNGDAVRPMLFLFVFWLSFMYSLTSSRLFNAALAATYTAVHFAYVPQQLAFTYVQTALMLTFVFKDLVSTDRKDVLYDAWAWIVNVSIVVMGWVESLGCTAAPINLVSYGGHVWYDACIPVSMLVFAVVALNTKVETPTTDVDVKMKVI